MAFKGEMAVIGWKTEEELGGCAVAFDDGIDSKSGWMRGLVVARPDPAATGVSREAIRIQQAGDRHCVP